MLDTSGIGSVDYRTAKCPAPGKKLYCLIQIGKPLQDSWTNIGIVMFGENGAQENSAISGRALEDAINAKNARDDERLKSFALGYTAHVPNLIAAREHNDCPTQLPWFGNIVIRTTPLQDATGIDFATQWHSLLTQGSGQVFVDYSEWLAGQLANLGE